MSVQPFLFGSGWIEARDGDDSVRAIFDRHYSRYRYADGRRPKLFVGPGEKMVLITACARAIFVWRRFKSAAGQHGINCAVFRNEGAGLASALIAAAEKRAWTRWPGERLYTYVDPRRVRSPNPGFCFIAAGWRRCGVTKIRRLLIYERSPASDAGQGRGDSQQGAEQDRAGGPLPPEGQPFAPGSALAHGGDRLVRDFEHGRGSEERQHDDGGGSTHA